MCGESFYVSELMVSCAHIGVGALGAGDRDRTGDIQLGKLTFYH